MWVKNYTFYLEGKRNLFRHYLKTHKLLIVVVS